MRSKPSPTDYKEPKRADYCHVKADYNCALDKVRSECFACGESVCTGKGCSRVIAWFRWRRKRVCRNCIEDWSRGRTRDGSKAAADQRRLKAILARMDGDDAAC